MIKLSAVAISPFFVTIFACLDFFMGLYFTSHCIAKNVFVAVKFFLFAETIMAGSMMIERPSLFSMGSKIDPAEYLAK